MKRNTHRKLKLKRKSIRVLDKGRLEPVNGGGTLVPDGYGFSLNKDNCVADAN